MQKLPETDLKWFITGTAAYGPQGESSDLDIVVCDEYYHELKARFPQHNLIFNPVCPAEGNYPSSATGYIELGPLQINIILLDSKLKYRAWYWATQFLKGIPAIEDRSHRVGYFKALVEYYEEAKNKEVFPDATYF
jgi:hypothetical protein